MKVSIVMPVYNEIRTLPQVLERLAALELDKELVVVDDGSSDGSREWMEEAVSSGRFSFPLRFISRARNGGKGAALIDGFAAASGGVCIVQDADLEYDPGYIPGIVAPIAEGRADIVYGSRLISGKSRTYNILYLWGNQFLTLLVNLLFGARMTDSYTCYKAFRTEILRGFRLSSRGFEIEAEISCKAAAGGYRYEEVPVVYASRSREEGKKINFRDAVKGVLKIFRMKLLHLAGRL